MQLKSKSRETVSDEYGITPRTLNRWVEKHEIYAPKGELLCLKILVRIYDEFGWPDSVINIVPQAGQMCKSGSAKQ